MCEREGAVLFESFLASAVMGEFHVPVAGEVLVANLSHGIGVDDLVRIDREVDLSEIPVDEVDALDAAYFDARDAHLIALFELGDVLECRLVSHRGAGAVLAEHHEQTGENDEHDDGEDREGHHGCAGA